MNWFSKLAIKDRKVATVLALAGTIAPISGLHKFYLGQPLWGVVYLVLSATPIPHVASAIEGAWYLFQDSDEFNSNFNPNLPVASVAQPQPRRSPQQTAQSQSPLEPHAVEAMASAIRKLEALRQDGLISEWEFEQKRRKLLD
ncbi:MAG: SHOCT domain-containing protein [Cyanobacteria bacterium P01_H01_bin.121]